MPSGASEPFAGWLNAGVADCDLEVEATAEADAGFAAPRGSRRAVGDHDMAASCGSGVLDGSPSGRHRVSRFRLENGYKLRSQLQGEEEAEPPRRTRASDDGPGINGRGNR